MTGTDMSFYKGKKVLVTGHTGFKGSWMSKVLLIAGAEVSGYALEPPTQPSLFKQMNLPKDMRSIEGDIRDLERLKRAFQEVKPEVVIHMAAQPIVRDSYKRPVYTYETNVMGTVNVLECVRMSGSVRSVVNVTTDKVYRNEEREDGYREEEYLDGYDPYSNSKSCSELVTSSYRKSFLNEQEIAVSTMRAGNVIGGGDYAADRIVPDCIRAAEAGKGITVRNPGSVRPYQHVLEPVMAYLMVAARQYECFGLSGCYNVGPDDCDCVSTGTLASMFCELWEEKTGKMIRWETPGVSGPHEANFLKLNCGKIKEVFGWMPRWHIREALQECVDFANRTEQADVYMERQIEGHAAWRQMPGI